MDDIDFSDFLNNLKEDPELQEALLQPAIIDESIKNLQDTNSAMTTPILICENPDTELPLVKNQLNFQLPSSLRKTKEPYALNIRNDLNMYKKLYEKYANLSNSIINRTKEGIKNLYQPLKKLNDDIKSYSNNFENSLNQLTIPLENKKKGLNEIDYKKYPNDKQKKFLNDKKEVIEETNNFIKDVNKFCENYGKINENVKQETEIFVLKFMDLADPAKKLTTFMRKFFKIFEKSVSSFNDLKNKKKVDEALNKIKEPISEFSIQIKNTGELVKQIEDIKQKNIDDINEVIQETKKIIKDLENKSNEIIKKIQKIREKYGEKEEKLKGMNINEPDNLKISERTKIIDSEQIALNKDNREKLESIIIGVKNVINYSRMDLLFIMDITNSMDSYLDQAKNDILKMINKIKQDCAGIEIFLGFIGYRDFNDLDFGEEYIDLELTVDYESIKDNIQYLKAEGGGDTPEDLCGGFELASKKDWTGKSRIAVLVTDSPCHGTKYHDLKGDQEDNFPDGDREKRDIEEFIKYFAKNEISLYCLKINDTTDKMFKIFKGIYDNSKAKDSSNQFVVEEGKKLFDVVTENAVKMFQNRKIFELK